MEVVKTLRKGVVPRAGVEPARPFGQRILSPQRLPFRHPGICQLSLTFLEFFTLKTEYRQADELGKHDPLVSCARRPRMARVCKRSTAVGTPYPRKGSPYFYTYPTTSVTLTTRPLFYCHGCGGPNLKANRKRECPRTDS